MSYNIECSSGFLMRGCVARSNSLISDILVFLLSLRLSEVMCFVHYYPAMELCNENAYIYAIMYFTTLNENELV